MDAEATARLIALLESIDTKLDGLNRIEDVLHELKMEVCGFEHEGTQYPGSSERLIQAIEAVEAEVGSVQLTLESLQETKVEEESEES